MDTARPRCSASPTTCWAPRAAATINYLIAQLEELGYLERRAPAGSDRHLIYLSARGRQVLETVLACLRQLEAEWADEIGQERFDVFLEVLRQLSAKSVEATRSAWQQDQPAG